ncbi:zinc finger protein 618 isoform X3 [Gadus macrocephalus]|uniref:zinc finger protein 618 isoform X3 n=1 Tax=Gadus macrocephalus TaxID=80720 RepID=UPI0028CB1593|nr:zinc finger protein 618 isoform X3 [Gadus macrocephalus]
MSAQKAANPGTGLAEAAGGGAKGTPASTLTPTTATSAPATVGTSTKSPVQLPVTVKTEPGTTNGKRDDADPAEICVVIGGNDVGGGARAAQTQGSYVCRVCGKKYKYYNCFQTHVRAHRETNTVVGEALPPAPSNNFRYSCDICGKKYKYYSCFQEHRDLHAVDGLSDPYEQVGLPVEDIKEGEPVEPYQKIGPKTGSYVCEVCGKQYKYFNPYQEHVALHTPMGRSFDMKSPCTQQRGKIDLNKFGQPSKEKNTLLIRKVESTMQSSLVDTNSSKNSSGTTSPLVASTFSTTQKPYTCGACGIQFQFYNNLLEHMQSHAADNENHTKGDSPKSPPVSGPQEPPWRGQGGAQTTISAVQPPAPQAQAQAHGAAQRNHSLPSHNGLPEKERQQVAERLLRVMCSDLSALAVLSGKDFLKLAQTLVDTGARHGAYSTRDALGGSMSALALRQLPRMYNQVKVKVTCALGANAALGLGVTCHSQARGPDACYVLTAHQVEGARLRRYVLGVREAELREGPEQVQQWIQNVLSEFVMSDVRTVYVSEPRMAGGVGGGSPLGGGGVGGGGGWGRGRVCLRCAGCSLGAVVQAVLGKHSLQARGLHELAELLAACREIASSTRLSLREDAAAAAAGPAPSPAGEEGGAQAATPPCWDRTAESLLQVHTHFEQVCEAYGRSKATAPLLQGLNKHLLATLACLLAPLRLAALELSSQRRPTLQQVLPVYLRLEKLFTAKAGEPGAGTASKLCHYFLEALKENFKVERAHQVAMILDPQLKLRPVPAYQHDEIIARACEMASEPREGGGGGGGGSGAEDHNSDGSPPPKRGRLECGGGGGGVPTGANALPPSSATQSTPSGNGVGGEHVRKELYQYLAEPPVQGTPDLFQYWSSAAAGGGASGGGGGAGERFPRLARLALWLLAVPAVGVRSECVALCEQSLAMKRRQQVTAEEMNKLIFLRSNMG